MEGVRNDSLLLLVPTAWRFAKGSRCPLFLGKGRRPWPQHSPLLMSVSPRMALATVKEEESSRREGLREELRCPLYI